MKKLLLLATLVMLCFIINAQSVPEIKPSVNAKQFISGASSNVGLHNGQPTITIPLFTLEGKGINVPITLVFNGADITSESEASNIGLGWSLMAGGVITATIRDKDDNLTTRAADVEWQYNNNFLSSMQSRQSANLYTSTNEFDMAMGRVMGGDTQPDIYNYSFPGYSGEICFRFDNNNVRKGTLYPDNTLVLTKTTDGYKITTDNGVDYYFESKETNMLSTSSATTSWFLSEIRTIQGGHAVFTYETEYMYDLTSDYGDSRGYPRISTKRLTRIDTDYGHVEFKSTSREDIPEEKRMTGIELYNVNGILIKGYELDNNGYFTNASNLHPTAFHNKRLKLSSVREYNQAKDY